MQAMSMILIGESPVGITDPAVVVSAQPDRFSSLPTGVILARSMADATNMLAHVYHRAIFLDAVLPGNQSAYRAVSQILKQYRERVGRIFIMRDEVRQADVQFARTCGADGVIKKDCSSVLRVLQSYQALAEASGANIDPVWLVALTKVASQFLASEAERAVHNSFLVTRQKNQDTTQPTGTIRALASYFDDEEDYLAFAREAVNALKVTR
jgi:CheY-like chemotaxis protein